MPSVTDIKAVLVNLCRKVTRVRFFKTRCYGLLVGLCTAVQVILFVNLQGSGRGHVVAASRTACLTHSTFITSCAGGRRNMPRPLQVDL